MAKFKVSLSRLPDFKLPVTFTAPNGDDATVVFVVKHKTANELEKFFDRENVKNHEIINEVATSWDLEEEFNEENVKQLADLFLGVSPAFVNAYMQALAGNRVKN